MPALGDPQCQAAPLHLLDHECENFDHVFINDGQVRVTTDVTDIFRAPH